MEIGTKLLLHTVAFPDIKNQKTDEFIAVEVVEIRDDVPDVWTTRAKHKGYKALGEDGHYYTCNWHSYPSDSMTPTWIWMDQTSWEKWQHAREVYDVTQGLMSKIFARPIFLDKYDFIDWCPKHGVLYYITNTFDGTNNTCFYCYLEHKYGKKTSRIDNSPSTWKGWF